MTSFLCSSGSPFQHEFVNLLEATVIHFLTYLASTGIQLVSIEPSYHQASKACSRMRFTKLRNPRPTVPAISGC